MLEGGGMDKVKAEFKHSPLNFLPLFIGFYSICFDL